MNPIQVLKGWVTLDEAAGYISERAGVQVAESDLLELAVEGKLRLSALFRRTGTKGAVIGTVVEREPGSCFIEFVEEDANPIRTTLNGVFELKVSDLPILCVNEAGEIESQAFGLEFETGVPGRVVRLPSKALPPSCRWVMRPSAVDNFLATLTGEEREIEALRRLADLDRSAKEAAILRAEQAEAEAAELRRKLEQERAAQQAAEPSPKSRNAYLRTIAALGYALIDGSSGQPHPDADAILAVLGAKGIAAPVGPKTLADYLKQAADT